MQFVIPQIQISRFLYAYFIHGNLMLSATHSDFYLKSHIPNQKSAGGSTHLTCSKQTIFTLCSYPPRGI